MPRTFLDTNLLVYSDDRSDKRRARTAIEVIEAALSGGDGVISTQVLQEYYSVTTRRLGTDPGVARRKIELYARMDVVQVDVSMIVEAIDLQRVHVMSFWDALILSAAGRGSCTTLLTEDLSAGRMIAGILIVDPFA
jgi:predicted nucleic acid-binding protein